MKVYCIVREYLTDGSLKFETDAFATIEQAVAQAIRWQESAERVLKERVFRYFVIERDLTVVLSGQKGEAE